VNTFYITIDSSISNLHGVLEPYFSVQYLDSNDISKESLKDSVALIIRSTRKYGKETLLGTNVKFIGTVTSGYEHIDTEFCKENGIFWATAHGSNAKSVAEYVSAALIEISKKIGKSLNALSLGIVGVGAVGTEVKKAAENFGMQILQCDPPKNLNDNIFDADIITLHIPLEKRGEYPTEYLANKDFFSKMKRKAWLINTARGAVCDSGDLQNALRSKHLGGAVIDVWENEPFINQSLLPLIEIATPHIAGHNIEAKINASRMVVNSLGIFFKIDDLKKWEAKDQIATDELSSGDLSYSIRADDAKFRKNPSDFVKLRNEYRRKEFLLIPYVPFL
jgi:erythronate-4-phosphate dehydrogenase